VAARMIFWVLGAIMFYLVSLWPLLQFAAFADSTRVHLLFITACAVLFVAFRWLAKRAQTGEGSATPPRG
jgi:hypothetical protein